MGNTQTFDNTSYTFETEKRDSESYRTRCVRERRYDEIVVHPTIKFGGFDEWLKI